MNSYMYNTVLGQKLKKPMPNKRRENPQRPFFQLNRPREGRRHPGKFHEEDEPEQVHNFLSIIKLRRCLEKEKEEREEEELARSPPLSLPRLGFSSLLPVSAAF